MRPARCAVEQSGVFVQVSLLRRVEGHCHVIVWGLANRQDSCDDQRKRADRDSETVDLGVMRCFFLAHDCSCFEGLGEHPNLDVRPVGIIARLLELRLDLGVSPIETTQISFNSESSIPIFCQVV